MEHGDKLVNEVLVPPAPAGFVRKLLECLDRRECRFVRPRRCQGVVDIDDTHDLSEEWHVAAAQAIRVSRAVEALVVVTDDRANASQ